MDVYKELTMSVAGVDLVTVSTVVAAIASVLAIIIAITVAIKQGRQGSELEEKQRSFQNQLAEKQREFEAELAVKQEKLTRELAERQFVQQRRRDALNECTALRDCLDKWYRTVRENINPNLSPERIYYNITELNEHKHFEQAYETHIGKIRAAHEPLCDALLQKAKSFHDKLLENKLWLHSQLTYDGNLNRLHSSYVKRNKGSSEEQASKDAGRAYTEAFLQGIKKLYFGADEELERTISQFSEQLNKT